MENEDKKEKEQEYENQNKMNIYGEFEEEEELNAIDLDENKKYTRIGNKLYDEDTLNRITIVRLTQVGVPPKQIRELLKVSRALVSKWVNYKKREPKKMGRPPKFTEEQKEYLFNKSEGKLTVLNKVSTRNLALDFKREFKTSISKSTVNNILYEKFGKPYKGVNSVLLTEDHIKQRLAFSNEIIDKEIKSSDIMFTDECRVVLFPKVNPQINVIRLSEEDKKNLHTLEVNQKRTFYRPKFEISLMIAGGISKYGLSHLVFCSGTQNNFSYKQFLLFIKEDMDKIKKDNNLENNLLFQQDNASCHKSQESMEALEVIFGKDKIWWPANSPDLSPIETVWSILKQELSKRKNSRFDDLRNNILDIWTKFAKELCAQIISEFDEKIKICKEEGGIILNKALIKKYKKKNKASVSNYDWESFKMEKKIRIVYNNKIIESIKKKCLKSIKRIQKTKVKEFKKDYPKGKKFNQYLTKKENTNRRESMLKNINFYYEQLINNIKKITPLEFINNYLNQNILNRKCLISTNFPKKIQIKADILKKLIIGEEKQKFNTLDEEINYTIGKKFQNFKLNEIKKYLPLEMEIEYFPSQQNVSEKLKKEPSIQNKTLFKENKEVDESFESEETRYTIEDSCGLIAQLNEKIKEFRKENKQTKEKEKKIKIKEEIYLGESDENSDEESEESNETNEEYED